MRHGGSAPTPALDGAGAPAAVADDAPPGDFPSDVFESDDEQAAASIATRSSAASGARARIERGEVLGIARR